MHISLYIRMHTHTNTYLYTCQGVHHHLDPRDCQLPTANEWSECVAVCCMVLPCVAVCCSVLQCVAVRYSVLQCVAVCCSVSQCVAVCCSVLQCVAVCLQCVAVCCTVWQHDFMYRPTANKWSNSSMYICIYTYTYVRAKRCANSISIRGTVIHRTPTYCWGVPNVYVYMCMHRCIHAYCSVLQCVAVYGSVLQRITACCSVLHCAAMSRNVLLCAALCFSVLQAAYGIHRSRYLCVAVCCGVLKCAEASKQFDLS